MGSGDSDWYRVYQAQQEELQRPIRERDKKIASLEARLRAAEELAKDESADYLLSRCGSGTRQIWQKFKDSFATASGEGEAGGMREQLDPCVCGHDHTMGREGVCGTFTCPCRAWTAPTTETEPPCVVLSEIGTLLDSWILGEISEAEYQAKVRALLDRKGADRA